MSRPSKWKEVEAAADRSGLIPWGSRPERVVGSRTLIAEPEAELVETEDGPALRRGDEQEIRGEGAAGDLLGDFLRLDGESPEAYLGYCRRFGMLRLCEHGMPHLHGPGACPALPEEPLGYWQYWSKRLRALLAVAARIYEGEPGRPGDWELLADDWSGVELGWDVGEDVRTDRMALGARLDDLLTVTGATLSVVWAPDGERPDLEIAGYGLFQNLARELVLTVSKVDGLAVCDGCGNPYSPTRKPRPDRRNFCPGCRRKGVPARLRKRDEYRRKRQES